MNHFDGLKIRFSWNGYNFLHLLKKDTNSFTGSLESEDFLFSPMYCMVLL